MCSNRSDKDISLEYRSDENSSNTGTQYTKQNKVSIANYSNCGTSDIGMFNECKCVYTARNR